MALWLVRGGKLGEQEALALEQGLACIGFYEIPDLSQTMSREGIAGMLRQTYPQDSPAAIRNFTGQLYAFAHRMQSGDLVAMPLESQPQIALGRVVGPYMYRSDLGEVHHTRPVDWIRPALPRTQFAPDVLYSLGALMTVCQIDRNQAEERVRAILEGQPDPGSPSITQVCDSLSRLSSSTSEFHCSELVPTGNISGTRMAVDLLSVGGYEDWHGIARTIFESEEKDPSDTMLVIAKRHREDIDIFVGPFRLLLAYKARLPKTDNEYTFNLRSVSTGLVVREAPNLVLEKLGAAQYSPEEKLANKKPQDFIALANRLSPVEREELMRLLEKDQ